MAHVDGCIRLGLGSLLLFFLRFGGLVALDHRGCPSAVLISVRGSCDFELLQFHLQVSSLRVLGLKLQADLFGRLWEMTMNKENTPSVHTCKFESFFGALIT